MEITENTDTLRSRPRARSGDRREREGAGANEIEIAPAGRSAIESRLLGWSNLRSFDHGIGLRMVLWISHRRLLLCGRNDIRSGALDHRSPCGRRPTPQGGITTMKFG